MTENSEHLGAVTGEHTTDGMPHGYSSITPFLALADPAAAIAFYRDVFGARVVNSMEMGGVVIHAELEFTSGRLQLGAASPDFAMTAPTGGDETTFSLALYNTDTDATFARAVAAGATAREEPTTFGSGDRYASVRDPFGVRWTLMTRVVDLSDEQVDARLQEWMAEQG